MIVRPNVPGGTMVGTGFWSIWRTEELQRSKVIRILLRHNV